MAVWLCPKTCLAQTCQGRVASAQKLGSGRAVWLCPKTCFPYTCQGLFHVAEQVVCNPAESSGRSTKPRRCGPSAQACVSERPLPKNWVAPNPKLSNLVYVAMGFWANPTRRPARAERVPSACRACDRGRKTRISKSVGPLPKHWVAAWWSKKPYVEIRWASAQKLGCSKPEAFESCIRGNGFLGKPYSSPCACRGFSLYLPPRKLHIPSRHSQTIGRGGSDVQP